MQGILIVDDSMTIRKQMSIFIKKTYPELKTFEYSSGEEAIEKLKDIDCKLVAAFLDYNMDGITGIEVAEGIKDRISPHNIALVSANIQNAVKEKAHNSKIEFIEKPITLEKIAAFIKPRME